ncbi:hypothetical protein Tco_1401689 [Tanacetum coccineum]
MPRYDMNTLAKTFEETLKEVFPNMVNNTTDQNMRDNLPWLVVKVVRQEQEKSKAETLSMVADVVQKEQERTRVALSSQVSNDIATSVPPWVDAFLKNYMNDNILHVHPTSSSSSSIPDLQQQLFDAFRRQYHDDHHDDDALYEGENSAKRQKTSNKGKSAMGASSSKITEGSYQTESSTQEQQQEYDLWSEDQGTDDDEVSSKEVTLEVLVEISRNGIKWVPTTNDKKQMQDALNDMMRSQYSLVLEKPSQIYQGCERDPNAPPRYLYNKDLFYLKNGNSKTRNYVLSLHKVHAFPFPDNNLKELNTIWSYIKGKLEKISNPDEVYSDQKIVDVIRIQSKQCHGQEFIKEIIVKRADGEMCSFLELDYKYLNKNDIEDMYLILESYQLKFNLTAPKLTFPDIEEKTLYTIVALLFVGLIYENSKKERRIMDIDDIPKFCNATLRRVLEKVKKINLNVKYGYKDPPLSGPYFFDALSTEHQYGRSVWGLDPSSSLGKFCLGKDVVVILSDKVEGSGDWNSPKFQDTANKEDDVEPGVNFGRSFLRMTKAITDFGAGTITIYPDIDPFLEETEKEEKSNADWDKLFDFNIDDIPLLGTSSSAGGHLTQEEAAKEALAIRMSRKFALSEEERPIIKTIAYHDKYKKILDEVCKDKVNENALADTGSDINTMPYRIYEQLGREEMKKSNVPERLFSTFDGFCHQTFRVARSDVIRNAENDSDDEEDYQIKRNKFGAPIYGPKPAPYLNVSFFSSLPVTLKSVNWKPDYKGSYTKEEEAIGQWRTEIRKYAALQETMGTHDDEAGSSRSKRPRQHETVEEVLLHKVYHGVLLKKGVTEMKSLELCHEFYSTYEFDKVCADDELQTKKIIKFRLGGLRSDNHINAHDYWLNISREENLGLSRSHTSTIRNPILRDARHQNGYANVAWVITRWMKRKGAGTQKESQICCGQFISKIARKCRVLTEDVVRSLSAPIYCRDLDTITLRDLIDSEGKLIPEDPQPGVPRVGIPRPPRASMQDLYDRMGRMEIRQEAIERMEYRQSYHWDMYQGVFEADGWFIVFHWQGAYNPTWCMLRRRMTSVFGIPTSATTLSTALSSSSWID